MGTDDNEEVLNEIVDYSGVVAIKFTNIEDWGIEYISKNINRFGYTSEQIYNGNIKWKDIVSCDDYAKINNIVRENVEVGISDFVREYKIVTEYQEQVKVMDKVHIVRDKYGNATSAEIVIIDNSVWRFKDQQLGYLESAVIKSKNIVIVRKVVGGDVSVQYLSPNVSQYGIRIQDVWTVRTGMQEWVYKADIKKIQECMWGAINSGDSNYKCTFRIVDVNKNICWLQSFSSIIREQDGSIYIESLLMDITEYKDLEYNLILENQSLENTIAFIMHPDYSNMGTNIEDLVSMESLQMYLSSFSRLSGLYIAMLDKDARLIGRPEGPMLNMGEFYDIFEKPSFKEKYFEINKIAVESNKIIVSGIGDENSSSKFIGIPFIFDGKYYGTHVVCSYTKEQADKLLTNIDSIKVIIEQLTQNACNNAKYEKEKQKSKLTEVNMAEELKRNRAITQVLSQLNAKDTEDSIQIAFDHIGNYLNVSKIYLFEDEDGIGKCISEWSAGELPANYYHEENWISTVYKSNKTQYRNNGKLIIGSDNIPYNLRNLFEKINVKALLMVPVEINEKNKGCLVFVQAKQFRIWENSDISFATDVSHILSGLLLRRNQRGLIETTNQMILTSFDSVSEYMFIKKKEKCEVIYANRALTDRLGKDIIGKKCWQVLEGDEEGCKYCVKNKDESIYRIYDRQLFSKTLNVRVNARELAIKWIDGSDARLVVISEIIDRIY